MQKNIIYGAIIAVVFFLSGFLISSRIYLETEKTILPLTSQKNDTYQAGWQAAKKRLQESGYLHIMNAETEDIKNISGAVQEINGNKLTIKIMPLEPLADPSLDIRIVVVEENTKITLKEQKSSEIFNKEIEEYNKKMQDNLKERLEEKSASDSNIITPPSFFTEKKASIADIKTGMQIAVKAEQNIKEAKEFIASTVEIMSYEQAVKSSEATQKP